MPTCTAPGCTAPATLQWTRRASEAESAAQGDRLTALRQQFADSERAHLLAYITEMEAARERIRSDPRSTPRQVAIFDAQIAAATARREAVADAEPVEVGESRMAVFGCEKHAPDIESAAQVHEPECMTHGPCACDVSPA